MHNGVISGKHGESHERFILKGYVGAHWGHKAGFRGAEQGSEWRREMLMEGFLEELIAEPHLPQGGNVRAR